MTSRIRLVGCQGSVQLAAALSAMRTHDRRHPDKRPARNFLAIYHLSSPLGQDEEFVECIRELAEASDQWERIIYFPRVQCDELRRTWQKESWEAACSQMRSWLGLERVDELFMNQVITCGGCAIAGAYPDAKLLGFGDGIGLNYSRHYFSTNASAPATTWRDWFKQLERKLRQLRRREKPQDPPKAGKNDALPDIDPEVHYLLLPNLFDQQLKNAERIEASTLAGIFSEFSTISALRHSPDIVQAEAALAAASQAVIVLTSNYAETKRMSLTGEIDSYCQLVHEATRDRRAAVIIKPHPRDSREKINSLRARLAADYQQVLVLDEPVTFYAPLEALVSRWVQTIPRFLDKTTMICVSSSALGLEYLYGCRTVMGFGPERVQQHFTTEWKEVRLKHERDLDAALSQVRRRAAKAAA
jgi:hypothetical protein